MRRNAKTQSTQPPAGRFRFALLLATAAAFLLVPAAHAAAAPTFTLNIIGLEEGGGTVTSETLNGLPGEPPIDCTLLEGEPEGTPAEGVCENEMTEVEPEVWAIALEAFPGSKSEIVFWEIVSGIEPGPGACGGAGNGKDCVLASFGENTEVNLFLSCIEGEECVTPPPPEEFTLTVTKSGTGSGTVTSSPAGINCGVDCDEKYTKGTEVTLTPTADPGSEFKEWSGACTGSGECKVTMSTAKSVDAKFDEEVVLPTHKLTVEKTGTGEGWIHSSPSGINCGLPCTKKVAEFEQGIVTLTASGSQFVDWVSCPGVEAGRECRVNLTEAKKAIAEFSATRTLTVTKTGSGEGWIHSAPEGINCGLACTDKTGFFATGSKVVLTASGSQFKQWTSCPGTIKGTKGRECEISLTSNKTATAEFTAP